MDQMAEDLVESLVAFLLWRFIVEGLLEDG